MHGRRQKAVSYTHLDVYKRQVLIWLSLVLTVVSLVDYVAKNVQVLTKGGM